MISADNTSLGRLLLLLEEQLLLKFSSVEDRIVVKYKLRNMCRIYVSLIMAPVRQFICVT